MDTRMCVQARKQRLVVVGEQAEDRRRTTGKRPRYTPRMPSSRTMHAVPCTSPRKRGFGLFASSISFVLGAHLGQSPAAGRRGHREGEGAHLMVSEGVTAKTASIIPAPSPASRLRGADTLPSSTPVRASAIMPVSLAQEERAAHLSVRERVFEVVVRDEAHARLHRVACTAPPSMSVGKSGRMRRAHRRPEPCIPSTAQLRPWFAASSG